MLSLIWPCKLEVWVILLKAFELDIMWGGMDPHQLMAAGRGSCYYPVVSPHDPRLMFSPQDLHRRFEGAPESAKTKALQTVIEMKASVCVCVCCK